MPQSRDSPDYWRSRARELREDAEHIQHPPTKQTLLDIAQSYEEMAQQMEAQASRPKTRT